MGEINVSDLAAMMRPYWLDDVFHAVADSESNKEASGIPTAEFYDIGDGFNGTIAAGETMQMLFFTNVRQFSINFITAYCHENEATLNIYANNGTYPDIVLVHDASGVWTITIQDYGSGSTIETHTDGFASDYFMYTAINAVNILFRGEVFKTEIVAGSNDLSKFGYGLTGVPVRAAAGGGGPS
jgi:hypothetical protein